MFISQSDINKAGEKWKGTSEEKTWPAADVSRRAGKYKMPKLRVTAIQTRNYTAETPAMLSHAT